MDGDSGRFAFNRAPSLELSDLACHHQTALSSVSLPGVFGRCGSVVYDYLAVPPKDNVSVLDSKIAFPIFRRGSSN